MVPCPACRLDNHWRSSAPEHLSVIDSFLRESATRAMGPSVCRLLEIILECCSPADAELGIRLVALSFVPSNDRHLNIMDPKSADGYSQILCMAAMKMHRPRRTLHALLARGAFRTPLVIANVAVKTLPDLPGRGFCAPQDSTCRPGLETQRPSLMPWQHLPRDSAAPARMR